MVVHCKRDEYDVYIGRPSEWGNPFRIGVDGNRDEVIQKFRDYFNSWSEEKKSQMVRELRGKRLGCWCSPAPCHGDILVEYIASTAGLVAVL